MVETFEPKTDYKVVGTRPIRHDGYDKVTGRAIYGGDMKLPGLIWGVLVRSPHAHANIKSINTSAAEASEGVMAIVTGADMPEAPSKLVDLGEGNVNFKWASNKLMAGDKVLYHGHPVAAIAAVDRHHAEEAARKVVVEYEVLPSVTNVTDAMSDDAPVILPDLVGDDLGEEITNTNIAEHMRHEFGDVEAAFAAAAHTIEREYNMEMVHQGYIEPHNATAVWDEEDRIKIWTSTQGSFNARTQVAGILQIDVSRVKVTPLEIGGGFGGKIPIYLEPVAALLAKKSGRPVKMVMERSAVFETTGPTPGGRMVIKLGADANGILTAATADIWFEAGAYPGALIGPAAMCIYAPYEIANTRIDGWDVVVNKPKTAPYRAPGSPQVAFAMESAVNELCEEAGWDSLKFRMDNSSREGTRRGDGVLFGKVGMDEVLEATKASAHWNSPLGDASAGKKRGRGIASGYWFNIGLKSAANLAVVSDGTVILTEGSTDIGGSRVAMAMHVAEVLGIDAHDVRPSVVDTESVGFTDVTGGSRTTYATGYACWIAANNLVDELKKRVAILWDINEDDVDFNDGAFSSKAEAEKTIRFKELAGKLGDLGGPATSTGSVDLESAGDGFGLHIADVEIDTATGKTDVIRYTVVQDVGTAIHPSYVDGQLQGGAVQGIGWALNEEYYMTDDGVMANSSYLDYRMPTFLDLPMIGTEIVEVPNPLHPYGVRGVGETPICPPIGALANAIQNAIGTRLYNTPMNAGSILEALK
ncbi:MAG TPA: xanthine dehydrogenase family protein molybdopterin-binding subunit [Dehalococcoidia bacterium]|jgi:CO/xanthine dehydrogenase Mo-binding subunit|nr:xanthine dehydrogenase family protein molybdopterin-binding subunit [Dehalococcoidia bacterium]MDP7261698.1 xanthine dehydrogenase family protein molybdopterin-binding subunit [Dehalococcoidia bacterium]HJP27565.1 xanthine dehydrogenase family protein molybdopterin-binding subunit [Dehalococcoidia bacterium]|tara:strand:+ start:5622 stop:7892 length:2271 start_codon:yes stop_codon:yes gene_type:complete